MLVIHLSRSISNQLVWHLHAVHTRTRVCTSQCIHVYVFCVCVGQECRYTITNLIAKSHKLNRKKLYIFVYVKLYSYVRFLSGLIMFGCLVSSKHKLSFILLFSVFSLYFVNYARLLLLRIVSQSHFC